MKQGTSCFVEQAITSMEAINMAILAASVADEKLLSAAINGLEATLDFYKSVYLRHSKNYRRKDHTEVMNIVKTLFLMAYSKAYQ